MRYIVYHVKNPSFGLKEHVWPDEYNAVAQVEAAELEDVFVRTNTNATPWWKGSGLVLLSENPRSTSVGDVVVDYEGKAFRCASMGWEQIENFIPGFTLLEMPAPPMLEDAFGYECREANDVYPECRYVAFCWWGSKLAYSDGQIMSNTSYHGWLMMIRHPAFIPIAFTWDFGSDDGPAHHRLLIDRKTRLMFVGSAREVEAFLQERQRPRFPEMSQQEVEALEKAVLENFQSIEFKRVTLDAGAMASIHKRMEEEFRHVCELRNWLDAYCASLSEESATRLQNLYRSLVNCEGQRPS